MNSDLNRVALAHAVDAPIKFVLLNDPLSVVLNPNHKERRQAIVFETRRMSDKQVLEDLAR